MPAHPHAPAAVTTRGNRVLGRWKGSHGPRVGEGARRRNRSASMCTAGKTMRPIRTVRQRAQRNTMQKPGCPASHSSHPRPRSRRRYHHARTAAHVAAAAEARRGRCARTHVMHSSNATCMNPTRCGAMLPSTARRKAASSSTNARGIARAADSSRSQASTGCSNGACCLSVGASFQTRPPARSGCVGRAGGARRCACCVAFCAATGRQQNHRSACAFAIRE